MQSQSQHDDARLHLKRQSLRLTAMEGFSSRRPGGEACLRKLSTSEIARLQLFPTTHQHERQQTKSEFGAEPEPELV